MYIKRILIISWTLILPAYLYAGSINILVGGGGFLQGDDSIDYPQIGSSNRALTFQVTNRIIEHISLGADLSIIDSNVKYDVNGDYLKSDYSYADYLNMYVLGDFDFWDNIFFLQLGIGLVVELEYKERIFFGMMGAIGVMIPITETISIPILARVDVYLGSKIQYPLSFALGFSYKIN